MRNPPVISAGVVPIRRVGSELRFLLLRCYGYWDFPKGETDAGEVPLEAARRELEEETGLTVLDLRWGESFVETPPYGRGKIARYYLAECPSGEVVLAVNPELGFPEHHEYRWVTLEEGRALLNDRVRAVLDWAAQQVVESPKPADPIKPTDP
jgi:bis(5'-nucleosidyl)-tetraphosphatase